MKYGWGELFYLNLNWTSLAQVLMTVLPHPAVVAALSRAGERVLSTVDDDSNAEATEALRCMCAAMNAVRQMGGLPHSLATTGE
jgi:hypothetical protein